uniref:Mannosidase beta like n=1 Tax=Nomascus leucogenys TaxID=61853 RepID=A0A2I3H925_NOMLE
MASDLDFSPPEVPEPTFLENLLWYGLFLGAIFQLICGLAIIISIPKSHEVEAEPSELRSAEVMRKPKATVSSVNKRPKKETKKKASPQFESREAISGLSHRGLWGREGTQQNWRGVTG